MTPRPPQPAAVGASTRGGQAGEDQSRASELAGAADTLAGLAAALEGSISGTAALASLGTVRRLAAELERGELALIEAARADGATWSQISAALGTRNRQTAQKRHADLARRSPRPPSVDNPEARPVPDAPSTTPGTRQPGVKPQADEDAPGNEGPAATAPRKSARPSGRRRKTTPRITSEVIVEELYELVRAPDYAETHAWHVLAGDRQAGLVRPTWHGERSRPGWEPVDLAGVILPIKGTGRITPAGNARNRDAAAVCLLRALQHQQQARRPLAVDPQ